MIDIYVPTYKKKNPTILKLIQEDKNIRLVFCVRDEELTSGFYDDFPKSKQVKFLNLGKDIHNIGETRQRILEHCIENKITYCVMFDDTVLRLVDMLSNSLTSQIIKRSIKRIEYDKLYQYIAMYSYTKRFILKQQNGQMIQVEKPPVKDDSEVYFAGFPAQAYILNIPVLVKHKIMYKNMNEFGLEDTSFVAECLKQGLIFKFNPKLKYDAEEVNVPKTGGNHTEANDFDKVKAKYDKMHYLTYEAYKDMMGTSVQARYRHYLHNPILFLVFDWEYYRKVLVYHRSENQDLIDHNLSYNYYLKTYLK